MAVWRLSAGREQFAAPGGTAGSAVPAGAGPFLLEQKSDFHDPEALTVCTDCQVFAITGIRGVAGAAASRVGLRVRKWSGKLVLPLPPETAAVRTRTLVADAP